MTKLRSKDVEVGKRLLGHLANSSTDRADAPMTMPVSYYLDPARFEREMSHIFRRLPLMLAFSCELAAPNAYKAIDVVGIPVLIVRGHDGVVRAFMNVCRHRGSRLAAEGCGVSRRIVCPYHAWAYDHEGELVSIHKSEQFGDLDKKTKGLVRLPCEERAGLIFVSLSKDAPFDLDVYLGGMLDDLESLEMDSWHVYARRELVSANWKAVHDGYVDGYHLEVLHRNTVGRFTKGALNTFDHFGPHQRIGFANQDIAKLGEQAPETWEQDDGFGFVRTLFPNVSLAVQSGTGGLVSQLLPGPTSSQSKTIQTFLRKRLPETEEEVDRADFEVELFHATVRDEDYATVAGVQQGMESGAIDEVTFGRNELGNQRLHEWIDHYTRETA
ncbi:MAG: phenylpropionate dioxygenase-like ring-hydroxylating dioxygenase large terminal subunit [Myxococcota bacterium]|jgi:phenylpropionate dioxygenase-like ring-hydroxylating dioxygenase large terminal subunit